jgi:hypothetical protein
MHQGPQLAGSFKFKTPEDALELLGIAARSLLSLEGSVPRNRALVQTALGLLKVYEAVDLADRVAALEALSDEHQFRYGSPDPALERSARA